MKHITIKDNQLTFTDGRFYRHTSGEWVPSVTTILEAWPKPYALLQWMKEQGTKTDDIIRDAGRRGTTVHDMTERYDRGEEVKLFEDGKPVCSLEEWAMFERYVDFCKRYEPRHHLIEQTVINPELGCAGTIDRVMTLNDGRLLLVDLKTSNGIYPTYWMQVAAYARMLRAELNDDYVTDMPVAILWLNAKTRTDKPDQGKGWQLLTCSSDEQAKNWELFKHCQQVWLATNEDRKPREVSYQLSHKREVQP